MLEFISNLVANVVFIFERVSWVSVIDLLLVTTVFYGILMLLRGTQAMVLLRGIVLLIALIGLLTSLQVLPAFSWLVRTTLPALLLSIPVIFAPEIRRGLERIGRAGALLPPDQTSPRSQDPIPAVSTACARRGFMRVIDRLFQGDADERDEK